MAGVFDLNAGFGGPGRSVGYRVSCVSAMLFGQQRTGDSSKRESGQRGASRGISRRKWKPILRAPPSFFGLPAPAMGACDGILADIKAINQ